MSNIIILIEGVLIMRKFLLWPGYFFNNHFVLWLIFILAMFAVFFWVSKKLKADALLLMSKFGIVHGVTEDDINIFRGFIEKSLVTVYAAIIAGIIFAIKPVKYNFVIGSIIMLLVAIIYAFYVIRYIVWFVKYSKHYFKLFNNYSPVDVRRFSDFVGEESIKKQKVYFCGLPDDYDKYLDSMSDEIFKNHKNVDIIYLKRPEYEVTGYDKLFLSTIIEDVQLIMFPVTHDLLSMENMVIKSVIPLALKNNIPLLPIMTEPGLEAEFNAVCGDIQLMSKFNCDDKVASYDEKLEHFLSSVLFDDSLIKQIRQAFNAYIFLSYRKKDREYAKEIMHLIHQNAFCRDIAIWYDEYLVPGERFNNAIMEACNKSQLFALVVTPSLLEKPNYVMDVEYPYAVDHKKSILPIIAKETNLKNLNECYNEIPLPVSEGEKLDDALKSFFENLQSPDKNDDPEHLFFIGLAYLGGIDVEKNGSLAVELFTEAAHKGLADAYKKLVSMYQTGNGVAVDLKLAAKWQDEYCEFLINNLNDSVELAKDCRLELYQLTSMYYDIGDKVGLERTLGRIENIDERLSNTETAEFSMMEAYDLCYGSLFHGKILWEWGQLDSSLKYMDKAVEIGKKLLESDEVSIKRFYPYVIEERALLDILNGDNEAAILKYEESLSIRNDINTTGNYYECVGFINAYEGLGMSYLYLDKLNEAKTNLEKGMEYVEKAGVNPDNPQEILMLKSVLNSFLGDVANAAGNREEAIKRYSASRDTYQEMYEEHPGFEMRKKLVYQTCKLVAAGKKDLHSEAVRMLEEFKKDYPDHIVISDLEDMINGD